MVAIDTWCGSAETKCMIPWHDMDHRFHLVIYKCLLPGERSWFIGHTSGAPTDDYRDVSSRSLGHTSSWS